MVIAGVIPAYCVATLDKTKTFGIKTSTSALSIASEPHKSHFGLAELFPSLPTIAVSNSSSSLATQPTPTTRPVKSVARSRTSSADTHEDSILLPISTRIDLPPQSALPQIDTSVSEAAVDSPRTSRARSGHPPSPSRLGYNDHGGADAQGAGVRFSPRSRLRTLTQDALPRRSLSVERQSEV
jgi:hypothetical protein